MKLAGYGKRISKRSDGYVYKRQLAGGITFYARINVDKDGIIIRKSINLNTSDGAIARSKLKDLRSKDKSKVI
jgi:hypothetical protein